MPTAAAVGFLLKTNAIDMLGRIRTDMDTIVTPQPKPSGAPVSQRIKLAVGGFEVFAVVLLAYFVVELFYIVTTPINVPSADVYANGFAESANSAPADFTMVSAFDPFFRQTQNAPYEIAAAPESNLKITIAGLRAAEGDEASGAGTAIVKAQGDGQKLVKVGEEIATGAKLVAVYSDRIEINRRGARETIYMRQPSQRNERPIVIDASAVQADAASGANADWVERLLSDVPFEPVRTDGRLAGFRVGESNQNELLATLGLEEGDVILAVAGSPLTSFERLTELSEELDTSRPVVLDINRRGEQIAVTIGG